MRRIWKLRKIYIPQAAALIMIAAAIMCSPDKGMSSSIPRKDDTADAGGTIITTTAYEANADGSQKVLKTNAAILNTRSIIKAQGGDNEPSSNVLGLHSSVRSSLKKMGLTAEHIDLWANEHPRSTLKFLGDMTEKKQQKVANVATFIRKVNRSVSPKVAWREACAMVFYSHKYNLPVDLIVGLAKVESRFNPSAYNRSGAMGVMQVMWKVHNGMLGAKGIAMKRDHMFDPERGVEAGVLILSRYVNAYGSMQKALNRYYGGVAHSYIRKINTNMAMLDRHSSMSN